MFTVSFYRLIDLCFLFVLLDILCRAFEWIGMIWYKLIHRFAKLEEQQFSNTSRFAKRKRQNQTKDDKSTFFPDVLSRCSLQTKGLQTWKTNRDMLFLLCVPRQSAHFGEDVLFPLLQQSSHVCRSAPFLFIYIHSMYLFRFLVFYIWININETCFRTCFSKDKGAFKSQGPDFTTENMRNTSKRLRSDGTSTWEVASLFLLGTKPNMSTLLKSMYNIYIMDILWVIYIYIYSMITG